MYCSRSQTEASIFPQKQLKHIPRALELKSTDPFEEIIMTYAEELFPLPSFKYFSFWLFSIVVVGSSMTRGI